MPSVSTITALKPGFSSSWRLKEPTVARQSDRWHVSQIGLHHFGWSQRLAILHFDRPKILGPTAFTRKKNF